MAFTLTNRGGGFGVYASSITASDTFTPATDSIIVCAIAHDGETMTVSGFGVTFTQIATKVGTSSRDLDIYAGIISSPVSGRVVITGSVVNAWAATTEIEGADTSGSVSSAFVQNTSAAVYSASTPYSLPTLSAFASSTNLSLTAGQLSSSGTIVADTGYTEAAYNSGNSDVGIYYKTSEDTTQRLVAGSYFIYRHLVGFAMEVAAASSVSALIAGSATASITETDVVNGTKTITITLTGDTWVN